MVTRKFLNSAVKILNQKKRIRYIEYLDYIHDKTKWSWKTVCEELNKDETGKVLKDKIISETVLSLIVNERRDSTESQDLVCQTLFLP